MKKMIAVALSLVFLTDCSAKNESQGNGQEAASVALSEVIDAVQASSTAESPAPESYTVFVEKNDYRLALYEPAEGCYTGAYILSNATIDYDIRRFEELSDKEHGLYSYYSSVGGSFPMTWILTCLSLSKTPNIILNPATVNLMDSDEILEKTAREIGEFYVPMFVQFAPVDNRYEPEKYKQYYRRAREIFKQYASNAAFVWTVNAEDVYDSGRYYPGDKYVDWVSINMYANLSPEGYQKELFGALDYIYYSYQKSKPIMISELAVSHLSCTDYVYRNKMAAEELERIYGELAKNYPRVKAVVYMDMNGLNSDSQKNMPDNFSVTEESEVLAAYKNAVAAPHYISTLEISAIGDFNKEWIKSPFAGCKIGDEFFISKKTVDFDMKVNGAASYLETRHIAGQEYFNTANMARYGMGKVIVNAEEKLAEIRKY